MDKIFQSVKIKATGGDGQRIITAIANSGDLDRTNEIVSISGIQYDPNNLPILLWQHKADQPLGKILSLSKTSKGLEMVAQIAKYETDSELKQLTDSVWESVKQGVIKSCSIGFRALDYELSNGATVWTKSELLEVSLVSVPAERGANITGFKAADRPTKSSAVKLSGGGVKLSQAVTVVKLDQSTPHSIADELNHHEKLLAAHIAYLNAHMRKSAISDFEREYGADRAQKVLIMADSLRGNL